MIKIDIHREKEFLRIHELAGKINGIFQHPAHVYKIMSDHFGDTFFIAKDKKGDNTSEIAGFMMGFISRKIESTLFIWQIAVSPQAQGKKTGSKLLRHTIDYAIKTADCNAVIATVETDNTASQHLFEKFNFQILIQRSPSSITIETIMKNLSEARFTH